MNEKLLKILKELKNIEPNAEYSKNSLFSIINQPRIENHAKMGFFNTLSAINLRLKMVVATFILVALISAGSGAYWINVNNHNHQMIAKANETNAAIQIKLDEIKYIIQNKPLDAATIQNIQVLLKDTQDSLEQAQKNNESANMEETLNKIKEAEKILLEIQQKIAH